MMKVYYSSEVPNLCSVSVISPRSSLVSTEFPHSMVLPYFKACQSVSHAVLQGKQRDKRSMKITCKESMKGHTWFLLDLEFHCSCIYLNKAGHQQLWGNDRGNKQAGEEGPEQSVHYLDEGASFVAQSVKNLLCNAEDSCSTIITESVRSPGGKKQQDQYSCLENLAGQRSLAGYIRPMVSDMTEHQAHTQNQMKEGRRPHILGQDFSKFQFRLNNLVPTQDEVTFLA